MSKKIDVKVLKKWIREERKEVKWWIRKDKKAIKELLKDGLFVAGSAYAGGLAFNLGYLRALKDLENFLEEVE